MGLAHKDLVPGKAVKVLAQDRDELARLFSLANAERNGFPPGCYQARAEPLLAGSPEDRWDFILSNIPAKAGLPVLEDFVSRSAGLVKPQGKVFLVAVQPLADLVRRCIGEAGTLCTEEAGRDYSVFVYGPREAEAASAAPICFDQSFPQSYPFYIRSRGEYEVEGAAYDLDTVQGAADFDSPGADTEVAAKLALKLGLLEKCDSGAALVFDAGQGHLALALRALMHGTPQGPRAVSWVLAGRNVLALATARSALIPALEAASDSAPVSVIPVADIFLDRAKLAAPPGGSYTLLVFIPDPVSETDRLEASWTALGDLAAPGAILIAAMKATEADRFDRKKPSPWQRLGNLKRQGHRALAYRKAPP